MKIPVAWLREFVDIDIDPASLASLLTDRGLEVESVDRVGHAYDGFLVGEVLAAEPHPNADRLRVCRVSTGDAEHCVVCGAPNVGVGDKAALAPAGTVLPSGQAIARTTIRGVASEGMLCAEDELGLSKDHAGILQLPRDTPAGTPLSAVLGAPEDVLTVEVTWNRPDWLSILGVAREVAAATGKTLHPPEVRLEERGATPVKDRVAVTILDPSLCSRYAARVVTDVTLGPSPFWMQRRLALCGLRPINNVVDITNYVMLEVGQPLHAFDYDLLSGGKIVVRTAAEGELLRTLDGTERALSGDLLVIADSARPIALAGVMGGAGSEIVETTTRVLIESACFAPASIRKASSRLGLATESSHRFERGVDPGRTEWAGRRAAELLVAYAGGVAAPGAIDAYPGERPPREVSCRFAQARRLLGMTVSDDEIAGIFTSLGLAVVSRDASSCRVRVPSFRHDLAIEADLIEEVARMHGLDEVPALLPAARIVPGASDRDQRAASRCRATLLGLGLTEVMHYSFLSEELLAAFDVTPAGRRVHLPNPVSADHAVLRDSLLPQVSETLGRNLAHQEGRMACFETGRVFAVEADGAITERDMVSIALMGRVGGGGLDARRPVDPEEAFLWLKGVFECLCEAMKASGLSFAPAEAAWAEAGWCLALESEGGVRQGTLGLLSGALRRRWRMAEPVALGEMALAPLLARVFETKPLADVPVYPAVSRDMAVVIDSGVRHEDIVRVARESGPPELTSIDLFDTFTSERLGRGKRSLAYTLLYRSLERTLTDEEANGYHDGVKEALRRELSAEIREN